MATEVLRNRFRAEWGADVDFDQRDVKKIDEGDSVLDRFLAQQNGDVDKALDMLVKCLKWRKTFGVQDLSEDNIERHYFESGVGYVHGNDKKGNAILILSIRQHKKDPARLAALKRFVVYCLEKQVNILLPSQKMTVIFDMTDVGLSQVDMDFLKFFIDCFKFYYPSMLQYLLVYNMPFILQAVWKIVRSWLSEGARQRVKFVKKSDLLEYVDKDQLLVRYGGTDTYEYKFVPEEDEEAELLSVGDENDFNDDLGPSSRKVRFEDDQYDDSGESALTLPPTQDNDLPSPVNDDDNQRDAEWDVDGVVKPENDSAMRKRHVSRFLRQSTPPLGPKGGKSQLLQLNPSGTLEFCGNSKEVTRLTLTLTNASSTRVAFKIKTTTPDHYYVKTCVGLIDPDENTGISIGLNPGCAISKDKFLVMCTAVMDDIKASELPAFWRSRRKSAIEEHKLSCRFVSSDGEAIPGPSILSSKNNSTSTSNSNSISGLHDKVNALQRETRETAKKLEHMFARQEKLFLITFALLLIVLSGIFELWKFYPWRTR
ncbi:motile sperm domain-containing protein 2-like [Oscarella lobularis]|uniref:motile sperm domain-containing protein 2-like n=1 Tax=Oscarella lobularis TaxID=121494 RepID=UPI0033144B6D